MARIATSMRSSRRACTENLMAGTPCAPAQMPMRSTSAPASLPRRRRTEEVQRAEHADHAVSRSRKSHVLLDARFDVELAPRTKRKQRVRSTRARRCRPRQGVLDVERGIQLNRSTNCMSARPSRSRPASKATAPGARGEGHARPAQGALGFPGSSMTPHADQGRKIIQDNTEIP